MVKLKSLLYFSLFSEISFYSSLKFFINLIFLCHSFENGDFSTKLSLWGSNTHNNAANFRDVVSQNNATEKLDECYYDGLSEKEGTKIPETNSHNNSACPIKSPNILNIPFLLINSLYYFPVLCLIDQGHGKKYWRNEMSEKYVEKSDFYKVKILLFFWTIDKSNLKSS